MNNDTPHSEQPTSKHIGDTPRITPDERWAEINHFTSVKQIIDDYKAIGGWSRLISTDPEKTRDEAWLIAAIEKLISSEVRSCLDRLGVELNEQIKASKENLKYHQENTKNERLIKEWAGGIAAMELFVKPIIKAERKRYAD